ncbi:MAG: branched-chain amino acid ABC transporter permease [Actinomycetota bacterium]|nr:branched-chain amino acid ABC transporter permease [Actinomycetota bacterium]MDQ2956995.1 branched-chain amino acid ABC transporter permease [Actinomycetota bacterium]
MSTVILLAVTGLGLGALYFLVAAGLSLIYGVMRVLNFAHGALLTIGGYLGYEVGIHCGSLADSWPVFVLMLLVGTAAGALAAFVVEVLLIRRLYQREIEQVLVTVGLGLAAVALVTGIWGADARPFPAPAWMARTTSILGADIPNLRFVCIAAAALVLVGLQLLLGRTRYGLIIRAGVENRSMVSALGIDVRRTFTAVFVLGGALAGFGGVLTALYNSTLSPTMGDSLLIYAFIVVVIGGLGSVTGSAIAAAGVALLQQFANYYTTSGVGDLTVVIALAAVLLIRPGGFVGRQVRLA